MEHGVIDTALDNRHIESDILKEFDFLRSFNDLYEIIPDNYLFWHDFYNNNSMEPTINKKSRLLINPFIYEGSTIKDGCIYLFEVKGDNDNDKDFLYVSRIGVNPIDKVYTFIRDNETCPSFTLDHETVFSDKVKIIGRVIASLTLH